MSLKGCLRRIAKVDMKKVQCSGLNDLGIYINFKEDDITEAVAMIIGPEDSVYKNGILFFKIKFPNNYPFSPPKVGYVSRGSLRIHPNLYTGSCQDNYLGKVCLSILGTWSGPQWSTIMDISSVLISIQSILDNNPLDNEPGFSGKVTENHNKYKIAVNYETFRTLIYKNIFDIPQEFKCFKENILAHYETKRAIILKDITDKYDTLGHFKIALPIYRIHIFVKYKDIKDLILAKEKFDLKI
jgi:ubiquitin-protein ligase